jgi:hypothetical protein
MPLSVIVLSGSRCLRCADIRETHLDRPFMEPAVRSWVRELASQREVHRLNLRWGCPTEVPVGSLCEKFVA